LNNLFKENLTKWKTDNFKEIWEGVLGIVGSPLMSEFLGHDFIHFRHKVWRKIEFWIIFVAWNWFKSLKHFFTIGLYDQGHVHIWNNYIVLFTLEPMA
jgi:hypothetical protein